jgi:hypothetical protein
MTLIILLDSMCGFSQTIVGSDVATFSIRILSSARQRIMNSYQAVYHADRDSRTDGVHSLYMAPNFRSTPLAMPLNPTLPV